MQLLYLVVFGLMLSTTPLFSQTRLTGIVLEENEKGEFRPLRQATVFWSGTTVGTQTDSFGVFRIADLRKQAKLVVAYVGYQPDTLQLRGEDSVTVILRQLTTLKAVEITGKQASTFIASINPVKTEVITQAELYKAACCNLSESFETNASVDVSTSDAVTGARQIQMLGLSGIYTQLSTENLPGIRGIAASFGLSQLPGSWIESIQISKGVGSVANGFESITGQINTELKQPFGKEKFLLNAYLNEMGRAELNLNRVFRLSDKWATQVLAHGNYMKNEWDRNGDGFMDVPDGSQWNVLNRWMYRSGKNLSGQFSLRGMEDRRNSGTTALQEGPSAYRFSQLIRRGDVSGKLGYIFPEKRYQSIGILGNYVYYSQESRPGLRVYDAVQHSGYASLIYQDIIGNTNHKFRTGLNYQQDYINEGFDSLAFARNELVTGAFFEYTYTGLRSSLVAGLRGDYNSLFGWYATPRLHYKFQWTEQTALRLSGGRGQRTANVVAENFSWLVSSRKLTVPGGNIHSPAYGLLPEIGWNAGGGLNTSFSLRGNEGSLSADVFHTWFERQTVVDADHSPQELLLYNLRGNSSALSTQLDYNQELRQRFDLRLSYRYNETRTLYTSGRLLRPFIAPHRGLFNLAWHARKNIWLADLTVNYVSSKRLPGTLQNPAIYRMAAQSPDYATMNVQLTRNIGNWAFYIGCENLTDVLQSQQLISPEDPYGTYFDASYIWGPTFGRMLYAGIRWKIGE